VLLRIEQRERERTGITSLKIRFNKVFGYYLEVTRPNLHLVPSDYLRKQTTVGAERFVTPELKTYEEQVLTAEEERCSLEYRLFEQLRAEVVAQASPIRAAAEAVALLDVLTCFAQRAAEQGYCRPVLEESRVLEIVGGRHPVVESTLEREPFVPNDIRLDGDGVQMLVITGPNMAGKSTVMRQVALTVLMAQAGSFVPAAQARIGLCDRIFTRVGAADNLSQGQSTFMVEMTETAHLLHHATPRSLVLLDEVGRGTSTYDGLAIAWAVAEQLHDRVGARTLFATHYHELTELARTRERVRNACVAVQETATGVVFLHKLVDGAASRSYGIEVARLAGLPPEVVRRASTLLRALEKSRTARKGQTDPGTLNQLGLFAADAPIAPASPLLSTIQGVDVNQLTPLQALCLIAEWQKVLHTEGASENIAGKPEG
jgi:DNA mismatch repair protein MutS